MTEEDMTERVKWSTDKVIEWARDNATVVGGVEAMQNQVESPGRMIAFIRGRIELVADDGARWLMAHVFEPNTGVEFDAIDWTDVLSAVDDVIESEVSV